MSMLRAQCMACYNEHAQSTVHGMLLRACSELSAWHVITGMLRAQCMECYNEHAQSMECYNEPVGC